MRTDNERHGRRSRETCIVVVLTDVMAMFPSVATPSNQLPSPSSPLFPALIAAKRKGKTDSISCSGPQKTKGQPTDAVHHPASSHASSRSRSNDINSALISEIAISLYSLQNTIQKRDVNLLMYTLTQSQESSEQNELSMRIRHRIPGVIDTSESISANFDTRKSQCHTRVKDFMHSQNR